MKITQIFSRKKSFIFQLLVLDFLVVRDFYSLYFFIISTYELSKRFRGYLFSQYANTILIFPNRVPIIYNSFFVCVDNAIF